jgi:hypothetical protein
LIIDNGSDEDELLKCLSEYQARTKIVILIYALACAEQPMPGKNMEALLCRSNQTGELVWTHLGKKSSDSGAVVSEVLNNVKVFNWVAAWKAYLTIIPTGKQRC